jgi:proline dehydrogenase
MDLSNPGGLPNIQNTEIAFASKSNGELKKMAWLFSMMNKPLLVKWGSKLGLKAVEWRLPFAETVIKNTIFEQFCGGASLEETRHSIKKLSTNKVFTILDYGAEGKETEEDFLSTKEETLKALSFASSEKFVPIVSTKVTGMAPFDLLEKKSSGAAFSQEETLAWSELMNKMDALGRKASESGVGLYIDAEESWIQPAIDYVVDTLMSRYNTQKVVIFNTFQLYRHDRLEFLKESLSKAKAGGYLLGAKLVRGAYMQKESSRASAMNYENPIQPSKEATDRDFDSAVEFCLENINSISFCVASHNAESNLKLARWMMEKNIQKDHPHIMTSQLYGMSDPLTFNMASSGFPASKYVPYGKVRDVIPYLIRRAQENTSVTGDMGREYSVIQKEVKRRGL